jgi:hypothetical protein
MQEAKVFAARLASPKPRYRLIDKEWVPVGTTPYAGAPGAQVVKFVIVIWYFANGVQQAGPVQFGDPFYTDPDRCQQVAQLTEHLGSDDDYHKWTMRAECMPIEKARSLLAAAMPVKQEPAALQPRQ